MSETASETSATSEAQALSADAIDADVLDSLVPPAAPLGRRVVLWVGFAVVVVAAGWLWSLGFANPEISSSSATYGGDGPVHMGFQITSESSTAIEITEGFDVPPGLRLLGYATGPFDVDAPAESFARDLFPLRLDTGEMIELTAYFEVDDCAALPLDDDRAEVTVAIASGPFSRFEYRRAVSNDIFVSHEPGRPGSWPATIAQFVCNGVASSVDE